MIVQKFNGISAIYLTDERTGITTFTVVPSETEELIKKEKLSCSFHPTYTHLVPEPMFQAAFTGDTLSSDFSAGLSLRNSQTALKLRFCEQKVTENEFGKEVLTILKDDERKIKATHRVFQKRGTCGLEMRSSVTNLSKKEKTLEFIDSFSISCLSPFVLDNDADNLVLHRIRNDWSGEGLLESLPVSHYRMESSWSHLGARCERFGQTGTMPARRFLPFVAIEDKINGVVWAASCEAPSSWQIEVGQHNLALHISGGQADYNFGHWRKTLKQGETFTTNKAFVSAVKGSLLEACRVITETSAAYRIRPESEENLPIVYNEYMFSGGNPDIEKVKEQIDICKTLGVEYFVVDAGWFNKDGSDNWQAIGDWDVSKKRFPNGLKELKEVCERAGMISGIWFEFENASVGSKLVKNKKELLLTLDGNVIRHGDRFFLDFRKPETIEYLTKKVIEQTKKSGIKYLKIDYNENVGIGVDGDESIGEGLRKHIECVYEFYKKILAEIPDLILEICSSGGMRHEPLFSNLGSMVSFSDLHFVPEGAVSACELHRVFLPRDMQVWATLYPDYDEERAVYTMAEGMLGRLCLSGKLTALNEGVLSVVKKGCDFYKEIKSVIKDGETIDINTNKITSLRKLGCAFSLMRVSKNKEYALFYAFRVRESEKVIEGVLPDYYSVEKVFGNGKVKVKGKTVRVIPTFAETFATVVLLKRQSK